MPTTVVHVKDHVVGAVFIGRGSRWGNPYRMVRQSKKERERVITDFTLYLRSRPEMIDEARRALRGKALACFCAPLPCHGDVLARVADGEEP